MLKALPKRLGALKNDAFLRAAGALVGGTAAAQGLGVLALPFLTRFYSPDDFSLLAIYIAILTLSAAITCLRLDTAIPLPESDDDAAVLLTLSLISAGSFTVLAGIIIFLFGPSIALAIGRPEIASYLWLVPFGIGLMGLYSCFQYMAMRQKAFPLIARTKVTQAFIGLGSQLTMGWAGIIPLGLLLGHALMSGAGVVALMLKTLSRSTGGIKLTAPSVARMREVLITYRRFPQFAVVEAFSNNAGLQLPILLIASFLVGPEAGFLFLAMRAVGAPMTIVGSAVAQVYYSHAAQYGREGRLAQETTIVFKRLSRMLVVPMLLIGPFAPTVFQIAFGPEWQRAGTIVVMMLPWYAFRLIASPISMVMHVQMRQKLMLAMSLSGMALRIAPVLIAVMIAPSYATLVFAVTSALYYGAIVLVFLRIAELPRASISRLMLGEMVVWALSAAMSFGILGVISYA